MAHLDPGRYDRSEYGYETDAESAEPGHRAARHARHSADAASVPPGSWPAAPGAEPPGYWPPAPGAEPGPGGGWTDDASGASGDGWRGASEDGGWHDAREGAWRDTPAGGWRGDSTGAAWRGEPDNGWRGEPGNGWRGESDNGWRDSFDGFVDGPPAAAEPAAEPGEPLAALSESTAALAGLSTPTTEPGAGGSPAGSGGPQPPPAVTGAPAGTAGGAPAGTATGAGGGTAAGTDAPSGSSGASNGRAGRNLPAAIGVGLGLGGVVLASLQWRPAFIVVVMLAVAVGTWEMARAVRVGGIQAPLVPLLVGGPVIVGLAWRGGPAALPYGLLATALAVLVWRLADGAAGYQRDVTAAILIATYVPFLASFAVLLVLPDDGGTRVLVTLAGVVLSDTGGYVTGVFLGRHPMAPSVSPKKSWEGLAGSLVWTGVGGAVLLHLFLDAAWWHGLVFGVVVSAASVLGDLAESLIKRDLGVKDMSNLLPGHGGLMDRLDSILLAAPAAYAVLSVLVPAA